MNPLELMKSRHSVRVYSDLKISAENVQVLQDLIIRCNEEGDLHIQLILNDPAAFSGIIPRFGRFRNVHNYLILAGKSSPSLQERAGYYGEKIVLKAQDLRLGTCWVAGTYNKKKCRAALKPDEELVCVISIGHFDQDGVPHKTKSITDLCQTSGNMPDWFRTGMEAVQLAPTAMNQQKFIFYLINDTVRAEAGRGYNTNIDLGIAKYHFELGAGTKNFKWSGT